MITEERRRRLAATESNNQPKFRDDILPSYTLVSGLPSYDAALEQHRKNSCLDASLNVRPTVFQIFRYENEKPPNNSEPIVVNTNWTNQSTPNNGDVKQISSASNGSDTKNDKLCLSLLTKLQTQISTESSSSCVSEKQQHIETS